MKIGAELKYVSTKLDDNGGPVDAGIETIIIRSSDIKRLDSIHKNKVIMEQQAAEAATKG